MSANTKRTPEQQVCPLCGSDHPRAEAYERIIVVGEGGPILKGLGRAEVADHIGLRSDRSLSGVELPPHDMEISGRKGWFPATIDRWSKARRRRGRPKKTPPNGLASKT